MDSPEDVDGIQVGVKVRDFEVNLHPHQVVFPPL
jgi:hypothetical protein